MGYLAREGSSRTIDAQLSTAAKESQDIWRAFLLKMITSVQFLGIQALPFRGHSADSGSLFQLMALRGQDDESTKKCMSGYQLQYFSADIQNELIQLFAHKIQRSISNSVRDAGNFCVIANGTTDISQTEQLSVII